MEECLYSPKEIVEQLELSAETLKKYSLLLEKNGMNISRNKRGHREYSDENIKIIKALIFLNKEKSVSLEDAASIVLSSDFDFTIMQTKIMDNVTNPTVTTLSSNDTTLQHEVVIMVKNQLLLLHNELEEQKKKDDEFQKIVTDRLEEQRELIIHQEEMLKNLSQQLEENKKSFWKKLFSK
ncbi:MerR family transcriptional regulator [Lysinibacillus fusiformis]|uniref:MerR HTH family regulatory protein n=1 Tax=Lysinibacillus fusiformis TaxID=28031 RepID=A0A1H9SGK3_9BACI|nr:MerR family transcriptional regulator [Lysinibacillus fusiformis]SCY83918.1 MerR HTH family regulatory protein [Lysinibacillus fusiformis]SEO53835.1 MerR HTH family regulatory protein [Lysinibacillus fusiformis]SER83735.1 MerR HTH family regulatory protein [Lysinibacillus fusiformis]